MSTDLDDQLAMYGRWLERRCGTDLHAPEPGKIALSPTDVASRSVNDMEVATPTLQPRRRLLLAVAACVVIGVGIAGLAVANRQSSAPPTPVNDAVASIDPPGSLWVLPDPVDRYQLLNGYSFTSRPDPESDVESFAPNGLLLGVVDGAGYIGLRSISMYDSSPIVNGDWSPVDTPSGPAFVTNEPAVLVAQQRNDRWLLVTTSSETQLALDLLDVVSIDEQNELDVDVDVDDLVVIHRYVVSPADVGYTASFQALTVDQSLLTVETATASTPLFPAAGVAERIEPTQINGARAWIATRADPEGEWNALVWSQTPNRIVAVSGQVGLDEVTQLALRLRAVDETAWKLALPDATAD